MTVHLCVALCTQIQSHLCPVNPTQHNPRCNVTGLCSHSLTQYSHTSNHNHSPRSEKKNRKKIASHNNT